MNNLTDFTGKRILVIGASSGIGRQIAITLSTMGASVVLTARRKEKLEEVLNELEGTSHACYSADFSDPENIEAFFKTLKDECGPLDGMVYSAGVNSTMPLSSLKPNRLYDTFNINFFGFVEAVRQTVRKGRYNEGLRIVAVSSNAAIRGDKAHTAYAASKAAMNAAVRCLAKELADKGIGINAVAPAMTETEMYREYHAEGISDSERELMNRQYLGLIQPEDVASATAFLLSPASRMMTGLTIPVDAGLSTS